MLPSLGSDSTLPFSAERQQVQLKSFYQRASFGLRFEMGYRRPYGMPLRRIAASKGILHCIE
jgi:hypothetical protein